MDYEVAPTEKRIVLPLPLHETMTLDALMAIINTSTRKYMLRMLRALTLCRRVERLDEILARRLVTP